MTVREARIILDQVYLSDLICEQATDDGPLKITGIRPGCPVSWAKFKEAAARINQFYGRKVL